MHIAYTRTVGNGKPATIEGIDIFELTGDLGKFAAVPIIYDTASVRSDFDRMQVKRRLVLSGQVEPLVSFRSMQPFAKSAGVTTSCSTY